MGWVNYLVVPKAKTAFVINRNVNEPEDKLKTLAELIDYQENEDPFSEIDVNEVKVKDLTLKQLAYLINLHEKVMTLNTVTLGDKLFCDLMRNYDNTSFIISELDDKAMENIREKKYVIVNRN